MSKWIASWNKFWFEPCPVICLAAFRILVGLVLLESELVQMVADFWFFYGTQSVWPADIIASTYWHWYPRFDLAAIFPGNDAILIALFIALVITTILLIIGFKTRNAVLATYLLLLCFHAECPVNLHGGDAFFRIALFLLCFSPCGDDMSVDRWLVEKKARDISHVLPSPVMEPWVLRLLQLQVSALYLSSCIWKLQGPKWLDGSAVYFATRIEDFIKCPLPFVLDNIFILKLLCYGTLVVEASLGVLVWVRPLRYWVLLAGVVMHLGIDYSLNIPYFEWTLLSSYVLFVYPADMQRWIDRAKVFLVRVFGRKGPIAVGNETR